MRLYDTDKYKICNKRIVFLLPPSPLLYVPYRLQIQEDIKLYEYICTQVVDVKMNAITQLFCANS